MTPATRAGRLLWGKNLAANADPNVGEWLLNDILAIEAEARAQADASPTQQESTTPSNATTNSDIQDIYDRWGEERVDFQVQVADLLAERDMLLARNEELRDKGRALIEAWHSDSHGAIERAIVALDKALAADDDSDRLREDAVGPWPEGRGP